MAFVSVDARLKILNCSFVLRQVCSWWFRWFGKLDFRAQITW